MSSSNKQSIIAFGAHPDDVEIGMGGTVAKLARDGYDVKVIIATLPNFTKIDKKEQRKQEAIRSSKTMGCTAPEFLDLSPEEMVFGRKFVGLLDGIINKYQPDAVFTQWIGDSHQDHQNLTRAVIAASRDVNNLFMYETTIPGGVTENAFRPQLFVDITHLLDIKANALECFDSQKIRGGHLWVNAVLGRCSFRGYQINAGSAEAFEVIKTVRW
jgi:LmbE family N-acetylglucosaminyl deacetylase